MSVAADLLRIKANDYSLKSARASEYDEAQQANGEFPDLMPTVYATVALALREVAEALRADDAA